MTSTLAEQDIGPYVADAPAPDAAVSDAAADWPAQGWVDDVRPALDRARRHGRPCALVTLCAVEGPSPRPVGAQMLVGDEVVGHLSGGCIEADVALHARACIADGEPRRLVYGRGGPWQDIRLACGGRLELLVERIAPDDPAAGELLRRAQARRPGVLVSDGTVRTVVDDPAPRAPEGGYAKACPPVSRLVVVGRDPTALAMCALALQIGFDVVLISPQGPVEPPPLAGLGYLRARPGVSLAQAGLDRWTAVAVATHESQWDEEALAVALLSPAPYVGALGARSRLDAQRARLAQAGVPPAALARLHAPIGRPGYGKAPWSVAVSAVSEVVLFMSLAGAEPG